MRGLRWAKAGDLALLGVGGLAGQGPADRGGDELGEQRRAAVHLEMPVDGLHVCVHRVAAQAHRAGDLLFSVAAEQAGERLPLPRAETPGAGQRVRGLAGCGRSRVSVAKGENGENVSANAVTRPHFLGYPPTTSPEPRQPQCPAPAAATWLCGTCYTIGYTPFWSILRERRGKRQRLDGPRRGLPIFARSRHGAEIP